MRVGGANFNGGHLKMGAGVPRGGFAAREAAFAATEHAKYATRRARG